MKIKTQKCLRERRRTLWLHKLFRWGKAVNGGGIRNNTHIEMSKIYDLAKFHRQRDGSSSELFWKERTGYTKFVL